MHLTHPPPHRYHTATGHQNSRPRRRRGDTHSARSLLENDCLPRLIDSLLTEFPPLTFPTSSAHFTSEERHAAERTLGFEPRSLQLRWSSADQQGHDDVSRFEVTRGDHAEEFAAVEAIFLSAPAVPSFSYPGQERLVRDVARIERVENGALFSATDQAYASRAVQLHPHGGQPDFAWFSARTPHVGPQYVW